MLSEGNHWVDEFFRFECRFFGVFEKRLKMHIIAAYRVFILSFNINRLKWCPHTDSNRGPTDYKYGKLGLLTVADVVFT